MSVRNKNKSKKWTHCLEKSIGVCWKVDAKIEIVSSAWRSIEEEGGRIDAA